MPLIVLCVMLALVAGTARAQAPDTTTTTTYRHENAPRVHAARLQGDVRIDGRVDEAAWAAAEPVTDFIQYDPHEGQPASERTEVRVLIGDDALYIGARLYDSDARQVKGRLARRDDAAQSDLFEVWIDAYHDHLTASRFRVNPVGAIRDAAVNSDGSENPSWDPVWEAQGHMDSLGWSAEIRIPLSQLRFNRQEDAVWGIQFGRSVLRKGEVDFFPFVPKKEQGGPARYAHLDGLGRLPTPRRLELVPYTLARNERLDFPSNDPFRSHSDYFGAAGLDLKYGLTSDLTLDVTVNPDFGQVEVDPAEVNLTAFETFFDEKRPFFVEGADVFSFGSSRSFNNYGFVRMFHSRRIGRAPQRVLAGDNFTITDIPSKTTIAGAAKITGKTESGWSIGVLDAITPTEEGQYVDTLGIERETPVEPFTHFFAGRVRRDFRKGKTVIGGLLTSVNRKLDDDPALEGLFRREAWLGGIDLNHSWKERMYAFDAAVTRTSVRGTASAIDLVQRSSARYYQRPDHEDYVTYDPTRTSLDGWTADASFAKTSGKHWLGSLAMVNKSPGFEANDLGFHTRSDYRAVSDLLLYQENDPGKVMRNWQWFGFTNHTWNFGNDIIFDSYATDLSGQFHNFWYARTRYSLNRRVFSDNLTRGGPQAQSPQNQDVQLSIDSDSRRSWSLNLYHEHAWNEFGGTGDFPSVTVSFRPSPTLRLSFAPSLTRTHALAQYVRAVSDPAATETFGRRYVFATLDQTVTSLVTRMDWTFTPKLTLQLYLQPLVVTGDYSNFKEFREPRTFEFDVYGKNRGTITRDPSGVYVVDPGTGTTFAFADPDFNFRSLLGNAVLRWEYRPGSTLFFVWQQSRTGIEPYGNFQLDRDYRAIFDPKPQNIFVVKATYWIGL